MELDASSFTFTISLAAVINGLGIVRMLSGFAEYLRSRNQLNISPYWVFGLVAAFQFLLHILMWWSFWNIREAGTFNFLTYLYVLCGPIVLFLGTSLLLPDVEGREIDLKIQYFQIRRSYFTVMAILWLWAIFLWPVLSGVFPPTAPVVTVFLAISVTLRFTDHPNVHAAGALGNWALLITFVAIYAMQLGGIGESISNGLAD